MGVRESSLSFWESLWDLDNKNSPDGILVVNEGNSPSGFLVYKNMMLTSDDSMVYLITRFIIMYFLLFIFCNNIGWFFYNAYFRKRVKVSEILGVDGDVEK